MQNSKYIALAFVCALALAGCTGYAPESGTPVVANTAEPAGMVTAKALDGSAWTASFIEGVGATRGNWPQLRWTGADRVAGTGGCNNFAGQAELAPGALRFGKLAATGKLCMAEPGGQEDKFFMALELTRQARLNGSQLLLLDASGKTLVRLERLN